MLLQRTVYFPTRFTHMAEPFGNHGYWLVRYVLLQADQLIRQLLFFPDRFHVQIIDQSQLSSRNPAEASPGQALNDLTTLELHL
ncbi:hypothetical protein F3Y22_tig00110580pilonHSYRG00186 [Hibiscus syriacus]|uniref:Uncharacterized protein n=1 Tax=Hibiscus syriacus TaxID=106335 RepID=A0A6A3A893_HIBSY|nr:hypothetical protein F3Y22_tig00110580pilonHSYRG00186 [Hibiscus syriacus]